jgi:hypothetical protein
MERIDPVGPLPGSIPRIDRAPAADRVGQRNPGRQPQQDPNRKGPESEEEEDGEPHIDVSA